MKIRTALSSARQRASEESRNESRTRENIFPVDDAINDERLRKVPTCPTVLSFSRRCFTATIKRPSDGSPLQRSTLSSVTPVSGRSRDLIGPRRYISCTRRAGIYSVPQVHFHGNQWRIDEHIRGREWKRTVLTFCFIYPPLSFLFLHQLCSNFFFFLLHSINTTISQGSSNILLFLTRYFISGSRLYVDSLSFCAITLLDFWIRLPAGLADKYFFTSIPREIEIKQRPLARYGYHFELICREERFIGFIVHYSI